MDRVRVRAWAGTVAFLVLTPGVVAGLIPGVITGWRIPWTGGWGSPVAIVAAIVILGGVIVLLAVVVFVRGYEEPTLELEYGDEYREYRRNVRGWIPRARPWNQAA